VGREEPPDRLGRGIRPPAPQAGDGDQLHDRDRRHLTGLLHQALLTVIGATSGIMAVLLLGIRDGPQVTPAVGLYQLFGYNLLVVAAILVLRVLVLIFRADR
jgi:ubiquinone biosynthesis protein